MPTSKRCAAVAGLVQWVSRCTVSMQVGWLGGWLAVHACMSLCLAY